MKSDLSRGAKRTFRTPKPTSASRIQAIDFTKGALVLFMVLYHWLNYFIGLGIDYRYLRFLTPSFIFITGFLISHIYVSGDRAHSQGVWKRLLTRGLKLLLLFIILNFGRALVLYRSASSVIVNSQSFFGIVWDTCVVGNVSGETNRQVSFYILIPISYLLITSAALISLQKRYEHAFLIAALVLFSGIVGLSARGSHSNNLDLMMIGLFGALIGFIPIKKINTFVRHPRIFILSYLCYLAAITVWNTPFILVAAGVCVTLWGIYLIGLREAAPGRIRRHVILLGKFSLFGYIIQIGILQVLAAASRHLDNGMLAIAITFVAAFGFTMGAVEAVESIKRRSIIFDRLYRIALA